LRDFEERFTIAALVRERWEPTVAILGRDPNPRCRQWSRLEEADAVRRRVRELAGNLTDERITIWARVRLGEERGVGTVP